MDPLSIATALVGAVVPAAKLLIEVLRQRAKERALAEDSLDSVLKSADLKTLGAYLDNQLGAIDVDRYARADDARRRVDRVLNRLEEFLGPAEAAEQDGSKAAEQHSEEQPTFTKRTSYAESSEGLPEEVVERLDVGDDWGALIRLRIALEHAARAAMEAHGVQFTSRTNFTRALDALRVLDLLGADAFGSAMAARTIANRAAHGQVVSAEDVAWAVHAGAHALRELAELASRPATRSD